MAEASGRVVGSVFWFHIMFLDGSGWAELRSWKAQPRVSMPGWASQAEASGRLVGSVFWFHIMLLDGSGWAELRSWKAQPRVSN